MVFFSFDAHGDSRANQTHQENHCSQFHIECFFRVLLLSKKYLFPIKCSEITDATPFCLVSEVKSITSVFDMQRDLLKIIMKAVSEADDANNENEKLQAKSLQ